MTFLKDYTVKKYLNEDLGDNYIVAFGQLENNNYFSINKCELQIYDNTINLFDTFKNVKDFKNWLGENVKILETYDNTTLQYLAIGVQVDNDLDNLYNACKIEKIEISEKNYFDVLVQIPQIFGASFWVDVTIKDNDVLAEFNQYIFDLNNSKDTCKYILQNNINFYEVITSNAINKLQEENYIYQDDNANWIARG